MAEIGRDILKAIKILEAGELVAIPTETVYGLAGNALDLKSVTKVFNVKNRPAFDPLIVHVFSLERARDIVHDVPEMAITLSRHFWPGPLTLVLPKKKIIPDLVTSGLDTVGIRSPNHPITRELLDRLKFPLAAPSANPFGYVSPTCPEHVNDQLGDQISYILDGGPCAIGIESTIVGFEGDQVVLYRKGGLSIEKIEAVAGKVSIRPDSGSNPLAPGQLANHYSPRKPLYLGEIDLLLTRYRSEKVGLLLFSKYAPAINHENQIILSPSCNLDEAAQRLFSALRELDKSAVTVILAEEVPDEGIGKAVNDRLRRASLK